MSISLKSMANKTTKCNQEEDGQSLEESDFSVSKAKRAQRKIRKKKLTKIVHTCCFFYFDLKGQKQTFFYQRSAETNLKHPEIAKQFAINTSADHNNKLMQQWKNHVSSTVKLQQNYVDDRIDYNMGNSVIELCQGPQPIVQ